MAPTLQVPHISGRVVWLAIGMALGAGIVLAVTTLGRPQPIRPISTLLSVELSSSPLDAEFDGSVGSCGQVHRMELNESHIAVTSSRVISRQGGLCDSHRGASR